MRSIKDFLLIVVLIILLCISIKGQQADSLSSIDIVRSTILSDQLEYKTLMYFREKGIVQFNISSTLQLEKVKEGIFCHWEDLIIEQSKLPIRFRLGSLDYTDHLEGKWEHYYHFLPNRP